MTLLSQGLQKQILTREDLAYFQQHPVCTRLLLPFLQELGDSVQGLKVSEADQTWSKDGSTGHFFIQQWVEVVVPRLHQLLDAYPPLAEAQRQSRFGNPAFRSFQHALSQIAEELVRLLLSSTLSVAVEDRCLSEMAQYLSASFGDPTRIDYGTGHELNFLCFLLCWRQLDLVHEKDYPALVLVVFQSYMKLMRRLQREYWLEPAGSHGVWGLDDYHFLPFYFGAAQLKQHPRLRPKCIHDKEVVEAFAKDYMYLSCIQFIDSVKTASLAWHSPMLNDISGVKQWDKVHQGLMKMFKAEVLGKLPIMQHFLFGHLLGECSPYSSLRQTEVPHEKEKDEETGDEWYPFRPPSSTSITAVYDTIQIDSTPQQDASHHHHDRPVVKYVKSPSGEMIPIHGTGCSGHAHPTPGDKDNSHVHGLTGVYALGQEAPTCCGMRVPSAVAVHQSQQAKASGMVRIPFD